MIALPLALATVAGGSIVRSLWLLPAAAYDRAESLLGEGRIPEAIAAFQAAGRYNGADAAGRALASRFAPYAAAMEQATTALGAGDAASALALVDPVLAAVPRDPVAGELMATARNQRRIELRASADVAVRREDWLAAESSLTGLLALDPNDEPASEQLAAVYRRHAPIVFARERALALTGPEGAGAETIPTEAPAAWPTWSPDRRRIAFTSVDGATGAIRLFVVDRDGSGERLVASGVRPYGPPVWSPDGRRIAFAALNGGPSPPGQAGPERADVMVVDVDTGASRALTAGRVNDPLSPSWSPDGDRIVVVSRGPDGGPSDAALAARGDRLPTGEVYAVDVESGRIENLSRGRIDDPWRAAWSPTDDRVLVYTRSAGMSYDRDRARVALVDADSKEIVDLPTGSAIVTTPVWSPDGRRVAYVAGDSTVVVQAIDGPRRDFDLPDDISRLLSWNPDGSALLAVGQGASATSFVILPDDAMADPIPLQLDYDVDRRQSGSPQWGSGTALPAAVAIDRGGTALDPE